ncbi:MAG: TRAP transporter large permease subunit, partial [Alphaproteobacteria bacterium]|nr:TRAP transporter large permease subunit [Alphaproteobacteria bacterium]
MSAAQPQNVQSEEQPQRQLSGVPAWVASGLLFALSALALYWTQYPIGTTLFRALFLMLVLALAFLLYPVIVRSAHRDRVWIIDWILIAVSVAALVYLITHVDASKTRATRPLEIEQWLGGALILCILEATRRTTGWALPLITAGFLAYALFGPYMPEPLDHRGYSLARIIGQNYLTLEGIFSAPLDVASTFIVLFTIYGAVLARSGAGGFFINWAFA